ncbi:MAG: hypothetical protein ACFCUT_19055 [Kiloniellaceae bacterium]
MKNFEIREPVCFHAGWQKAASTTLQLDLFDRHSQIANLGKPTKSLDFYRYILRTEAADYDIARCRAIWDETVAMKVIPGRALVYSYENIATSPGIDRSLGALRIAELFPESRVVLVIRNQFTLLESLFTHLLVTQKIFGTFEQWIRTQLAGNYNTFIAHARFYQIWDLYRRLLGEQRVLVLLF